MTPVSLVQLPLVQLPLVQLPLVQLSVNLFRGASDPPPAENSMPSSWLFMVACINAVAPSPSTASISARILASPSRRARTSRHPVSSQFTFTFSDMWRSLLATVSLLGAHVNVCRAGEGQRLNLKELPFEKFSSGNEKEDIGQRFSGYFRLNRTYSAEMFFFMFERRREAASAPVVVWMTGGPGCSSELAVLYENGPWSLRRDSQGEIVLDETKYGWDEAATMIFVDQPVNTGFSFSDNEEDRCYDEEYVSRFAGHPHSPPCKEPTSAGSLTRSLFSLSLSGAWPGTWRTSSSR